MRRTAIARIAPGALSGLRDIQREFVSAYRARDRASPSGIVC